jgi:hypothetical protein
MDVFIKALYNRVKAGQIFIEQIPEVYRNEILQLMESDESEE